MKIDIYTHIFPKKFFEEFVRRSKGLGGVAERYRQLPAVLELDARFREMDQHGNYRQVIALPHPGLEEAATPEQGAILARVANDEMAELCTKHPDRFTAFVGTVSLTDVDAAVAEADRAVTQLGARGLQIYTNIIGRPLDAPEYRPIFEIMARHDLPIWLHPASSPAHADYASETMSRFEMWWCFGWPYETSVAMARLVFSGVFERHPQLKIITHHLGGMIPFFDGRIGAGMQFLVLSSLKRPHLDYFRMFYGTARLPS